MNLYVRMHGVGMKNLSIRQIFFPREPILPESSNTSGRFGV